MTIALAQAIPAIASTNSGFNVANTLPSNALGSNPTVGNYLTYQSWGWNAHHLVSQPVTVTDTGGNVYTTYWQQIDNDLWLSTGWAKVATSGASFKVTIHAGGWATGGDSANIVVSEWSGVAGTSPVDGTPTGTTGTSVTVAPGNMTVTAGSLVIAVGTDDNTSFLGSTPSTFTRAGFQNDGSANQTGEAIYRIGGASPSNPSRTITSAKWAAQQFALLAAAVAGISNQIVNINQSVKTAVY